MKDECVLITGGTGKLGKCFTKHLLKHGYKVLVTTTDNKKAEDFRDQLDNKNQFDFIKIDLSAPEAIDELLEEIETKNIKVNHLVNNARSLKSLKVNENGFSDREDMMMEYVMHVAVPYELSIKLYLAQKEFLKTIINIGSQYGNVAVNPELYKNDLSNSPIQYSLAKSALHHLTKELAVRLSHSKIRVNCIAFGGVDGRVDNEFKNRYSKLTPLGRMLKEDEVVGPLEFLLSDSSSSITGEIISADGGWTIW